MDKLIPPVPNDPQTPFVWQEWFKKIRFLFNDFVINIVQTFSTRGTFLTKATLGGETIIYLDNTEMFPTSGTGVVFDTTNDRDQFTYTGKTDFSLTGVSGILAHNINSTVIPLAKSITISSSVNEMRFYGDRGDGTIIELASIGINQVGSDQVIGQFGSAVSGDSRIGVRSSSDSAAGVFGSSVSDAGVRGFSTSGVGINAFSSSGYGLTSSSATSSALGISSNVTSGALFITPIGGRPSNRTEGQFANIYTTGGTTDNRTGTAILMYTDGTNWKKVFDNSIWTG